MNVLVIPEDFRKDQYILKPIIEAMLRELGAAGQSSRLPRPVARRHRPGDEVGTDSGNPRPLSRHGGCLSAHCGPRRQTGTPAALDNLEQKPRSYLPAGRVFLAENAWQEVEVWILAGHDLPEDWAWKEIRQDPNPKEAYFEPFAKGAA